MWNAAWTLVCRVGYDSRLFRDVHPRTDQVRRIDDHIRTGHYRDNSYFPAGQICLFKGTNRHKDHLIPSSLMRSSDFMRNAARPRSMKSVPCEMYTWKPHCREGSGDPQYPNLL